MGVAFVAEATDGVLDTLLSSVPPDGQLEKVLLEVGGSMLTSKERWEGARGVHRRRRCGGVARSVGRGALEISRGRMVSVRGVAGLRGGRLGAGGPKVRSKIGSTVARL